jgi:outer membrane protein OmpA-like peptidoglycan-associated protein
MTWFKRALPAVALALLLSSSSAHAQVVGRPIEVSAGAGYAPFDTRAYTKDGLGLTGSLGWRAAHWATLELGGLYIPTSADTLPEPNVALLLASMDVRFNLRPAENKVVPFVITGFGYGSSTVDGATPDKLGRGTPSLGAGVLFNLFGSPRSYARVQVRDVMFKERNAFEYSHDFAATLGFQYIFGGKYKDQDLDGVRDWIDNCPATPIGATVNTGGCPSDADRDSVVDGVDKCPDTPFGCKVDAKGCPIDSDGDGVCDGVDKCPDTPKGAHVDSLGCPTDADRDSVYDGLDQCPNTPPECKVDANGCPIDTDGDGVCDALDKCPNTPKTAQVDANGCETAAANIETELLDTGRFRIENVKFETGKATLLPEGFPTLDAAGTVLSKWPELKVEIGGHTDAQGSAGANKKLSQARAESVRSYLLEHNPELKPDQIVAKGYGSSKSIASNGSEQGRALNRRVEVVVLNKGVLVQSGGQRRVTNSK